MNKRNKKSSGRPMSLGAYPPTEPNPRGNYEQRRAFRAIQRKLTKLRQTERKAELAKLPPVVRKLLAAHVALTDTVNRKRRDG